MAAIVAGSMAAAFGQQAVPPPVAERVPVVTVCEVMKDLPGFKGRTIIVVGRSVGTSEGSWLDQECTEKLVTNGFRWSTSISLTYVRGDRVPPPLPEGFRWDKPLLSEKLAAVQQTTKLRVLPQYHYSDQWMALYGRLETPFPLKDSDYPPGENLRFHPAGLGHLNGSPAELIWPPKGYHKLRGAKRTGR